MVLTLSAPKHTRQSRNCTVVDYEARGEVALELYIVSNTKHVTLMSLTTNL
jgi:hypothetical protein